jgi:nicotinate-nucleotide pyrophosphorylase (carboxylating)
MSKLPSNLAQQVATALAEDIGSGDITAELVPAAQRVTGKVITREDATLCGRPWVVEVFRQLDPSVQLKWHADDGDRVTANQTLFEIAGLARPVLTGERNALNFLQLLSATATATRGYVDAIAVRALRFWIRAKQSPDCEPPRNTRSCVAAARTTGSACLIRC